MSSYKETPPPSSPAWAGRIPNCCPINSCRLCKCDFRETPWAKIPGTVNGCMVCATPEKRRELEEQAHKAVHK